MTTTHTMHTPPSSTSAPAPASASGPSATAFRAVLVLLGTASTFVAINAAFGGLETLGLQGPSKYFQVTDNEAFSLRDSHARFYGGVYLGIGLFFILAATNLRRYRTALNVVFSFVFVGGLSRLSQFDPGVTFGNDLAVSTVIEIIGMPALALWLASVTKSSEASSNASRPLASNA